MKIQFASCSGKVLKEEMRDIIQMPNNMKYELQN